MNIYIWESLDHVSNNYHEGGGVTAIAESLESARALFVEEVGGGDITSKEPDFTAGCDATTEKLFVFPDAGCC